MGKGNHGLYSLAAYLLFSHDVPTSYPTPFVDRRWRQVSGIRRMVEDYARKRFEDGQRRSRYRGSE